MRTPPTDGRFTHRPNYQGRYWKKSFFDAVEVIKTAAERNGSTSVEATYRWLAYHSMLNGDRGDGILIGASKLEHLLQNMETLKAGPLPEDVVEAFETAWTVTEGDSPECFTLYKGKGSVGGEKNLIVYQARYGNPTRRIVPDCQCVITMLAYYNGLVKIAVCRVKATPHNATNPPVPYLSTETTVENSSFFLTLAH